MENYSSKILQLIANVNRLEQKQVTHVKQSIYHTSMLNGLIIDQYEIVYTSDEFIERINDIDKESDREVTKEILPLEGDIGVVNIIEDVNDNITTPFVDLSSEEWIKDAVLDVAYYLRSHKFNDFDRRYFKEPSGESSSQYKAFPSPPLRYLHWEVYSHCDVGFYECLVYLHDTVLKADLVRSMDTNVVMNQRQWEYPRNGKSIEKVEKECKRLKEIEWRNADPFKGPLERFQWRVSASYYMCYFTMLEYSPLIMFGERCDNHANCLEGRSSRNNDPRADDSKPFQCAMYSFCPDVCCPAKQISDLGECLDNAENPCYWHTEREKRECSFNRTMNRGLVSMALNEWNVTCECDAGYEWDSMFGMCVDVDECATGRHTCNAVDQVCVNLRGEFGCVCAWGYMNVTGTCVPNLVLTSALSGLHEHYHPPPAKPAKPFSIFKFLFNFRLFKVDEQMQTFTDMPLMKNVSGNQIILPIE